MQSSVSKLTTFHSKHCTLRFGASPIVLKRLHTRKEPSDSFSLLHPIKMKHQRSLLFLSFLLVLLLLTTTVASDESEEVVSLDDTQPSSEADDVAPVVAPDEDVAVDAPIADVEEGAVDVDESVEDSTEQAEEESMDAAETVEEVAEEVEASDAAPVDESTSAPSSSYEKASPLSKVKAFFSKNKKKVAGGVLVAWGISLGVGWVSSRGGKPSQQDVYPVPSKQKGR